MKELLTKKFWLDVKKTFDEARNEPPNAEAKPQDKPAAEVPPVPEAIKPED